MRYSMSTAAVKVMAFAIVLSVLAGACIAELHKDVKDSVKKLNIIETPVTVSAPGTAEGAVVKSLDTGAMIPCQVESDGKQLMITWIMRGKAGEKPKGVKIELTDKPAKTDFRGIQLKKADDAVDVMINGELFTRYIYSGAPKPYCYPIIGSTEKSVTRNYPMQVVEGETNDHPHHRSFWFTFGDVNGIDFWSESPKAGKIVHREFDDLVSGPVYGKIRERNDWIGPDGKKVCEDIRELRIYRTTTGRLMDFDVTIRATQGPVKLGDTKEGMMGFRVATSMDVDKGQGHIENSHGNKDADTWGKQAEWCDYYGPVDGETVGIAIMDHPSSFRHPTYWHVRTYGLFAANPFGLRDFTGDKSKDGSHTIPLGGTITFRYRIFIHKGTTQDAGIADVWAAYAHPPTITVK